ncbi:hypothetical protein GCM10027062_03800 [Nocardioides hungaricus]
MERIGLARIGSAVATLGVAATLTACSGGDGGGDGGGGGNDFATSPAKDIVAETKADMGDLEAVKVSGTVTTNGQQITIDLQASSEGDCTGSIGIDDGTAELLGVGGETWMRPDEAFWRSFAGQNAEQVLTLVGDKWVVIPAGGKSFGQFCDLDDLLNQLLEDEDDGSTYSVTGTDDLDGDEVVLVDNEDPKNGTSTGYVLVDEPHYLVKIEKTEGDDIGTVSFSAFDEAFQVEAPTADQVVDLNTIGS